MKPQFNRTWLLVSIIIIGNIIIFSFMSKKLEIFVANDMTNKSSIEGI